MRRICGRKHPSTNKIWCDRIAKSPRDHVGPCSASIVVEWDTDEHGKLIKHRILGGKARRRGHEC